MDEEAVAAAMARDEEAVGRRWVSSGGGEVERGGEEGARRKARIRQADSKSCDVSAKIFDK